MTAHPDPHIEMGNVIAFLRSQVVKPVTAANSIYAPEAPMVEDAKEADYPAKESVWDEAMRWLNLAALVMGGYCCGCVLAAIVWTWGW